jgi:hypothetical protein
MMRKRFPLLAMVAVVLTGAAAAALVFFAELPVRWVEWIDTGSGRVVYVRRLLGLPINVEGARTSLAGMYSEYAGEPRETNWVELRSFNYIPDWLEFTGYQSYGTGFEQSSEYLQGSLGLFLVIDRDLLTEEEYAQRMEVLDRRYTRECRREIMLRTMEVVSRTGGVKAAADFVHDVFALEQTTREPLTPEHLPAVEEYTQRFRDGR